MKAIVIAVLLNLPMVAHAEVTNETFCFSSGGAKSVDFEMHTYFDSARKFSSGFVKYRNARQLIPLVQFSSNSETLDSNTPEQETTTWIEIFDGRVSGEYEMTTQGTGVPSMIYTSRAKNRKTGFFLNTDVMRDGDCKW